MSRKLNLCNTCRINGIVLIMHLVYADDLAILSPYSDEPQLLL